MRQLLAQQEAAAVQLAAAKESAEAAVAELKRELTEAQEQAIRAKQQAEQARVQAEEMEAQKMQLKQVRQHAGCAGLARHARVLICMPARTGLRDLHHFTYVSAGFGSCGESGHRAAGCSEGAGGAEGKGKRAAFLVAPALAQEEHSSCASV